MKSSIEFVNFDWLLNDGTQIVVENEAFQDVECAQIPMPKSIGTGSYEAWALSIGASIYRAHYNFNPEVGGQLIPTALVTASFNEPTLMIHTLKTGRIIHNDALANNDLIFGDGVDLFRYDNKISVTPIVDASDNIEMTSLFIGHSFLTALIGEALAEKILLKLGLLPMPRVVVKVMPNYVNYSLKECLRSDYTSQLKKMWAQARSLEYISELATHVSHAQSKIVSNGVQNRKLSKEVHQYLMSLDGKLPTIDSLAQTFGRSARALNEGFQTEYGESIFSFMLNHRLSAAHEAIKNTPVPLKQISMQLGYAHVNHFSAAFRKKFGYPPGTLRK